MPKEWTDDEVSAEINAAVKIVAEDRLFRGLSEKLKGSATNPNGTDTGGTGNTGGNPGTGDGNPKPKRSLFWGEAVE